MAETLGVVCPSGGTPHDPYRTAVSIVPMELPNGITYVRENSFLPCEPC